VKKWKKMTVILNGQLELVVGKEVEIPLLMGLAII
jgi:hypothetical protein